MPSEAAFLSAIDEAPDDLVHRMAYADWLLERGGPDAERGELLFVQCELARRDGDWDEECVLLRAREGRLLRANRGAWLPAGRPEARVLFRRGLPEVLRLNAPEMLRAQPDLAAPVVRLEMAVFLDGTRAVTAQPMNWSGGISTTIRSLQVVPSASSDANRATSGGNDTQPVGIPSSIAAMPWSTLMTSPSPDNSADPAAQRRGATSF